MSARLDIPDRPPDWSDSHSGLTARPDLPARAQWQWALGHMPRWASAALTLRNRVVGLLGLRGVSRGALETNRHPMDSLPVLTETDAVFETGLTDRHLTFTVLAEKEESTVTVTTRIWFHRWWGRVYLWVVLPAHVAIVQHGLRSLARMEGEAPA